jgi:HSP20 family protein
MAALSRRDPTSEEFGRLFRTLFEAGGRGEGFSPPLDVLELHDRFLVRLDLPGMGHDEVAVEVDDDTLTVSGERRAEHEGRTGAVHRVERAVGAFSRTLTLPRGIDAGAITARFERGVLELSIPKPAETQPRRIAIGRGGG